MFTVTIILAPDFCPLKKKKKKTEMAGFSIGSGLDHTFSPPGIQLSHLFPRI